MTEGQERVSAHGKLKEAGDKRVTPALASGGEHRGLEPEGVSETCGRGNGDGGGVTLRGRTALRKINKQLQTLSVTDPFLNPSLLTLSYSLSTLEQCFLYELFFFFFNN